LLQARSHLIISNKWSEIVQCYGLTQNPSNGNYMLVMNIADMNLREYLQQNHNQLTWKERIQIAVNIVYALGASIHRENAIHRDLHSGNILYSQLNQTWNIGDLGFCGPADKPLKSIYGNLPYIAPEVIAGKQTTKASDIYSIGILMWEISSGQPPFVNKHNYDLAIKIVNGIRPKTIPGTPLEYKELMEQCWDADPTKRPNTKTLLNKIRDIYRLYCLNENNEQEINNITNNSSNSQLNTNFSSVSSGSTNFFFSKIYDFEGLPEPRNATKGKYYLF